jgi:hypothetical protein
MLLIEWTWSLTMANRNGMSDKPEISFIRKINSMLQDFFINSMLHNDFVYVDYIKMLLIIQKLISMELDKFGK